MRLVLQRVSWARVKVKGQVVGAINSGIMALVGATHGDTESDADMLAERTVNLRIFEDENEKMNLSLLDKSGSLLAISQFTLYADTRKGRRPSFTDAMDPMGAEKLFNRYKASVAGHGIEVQSGVFGAHMEVELCNSGPVTIIMSSEEKRS